MKIVKLLAWGFLVACSGTAVVVSSVYLYLSPSLPSVETLRDTRYQTPLRIFTKDEKLIAEFGEKRRTPIRFQEVPTHLIEAFMAAEDDRFYEHHGVDVTSLLRAFVQLVSTGRIQSGGSTITMQVAKNFFLSHERVFSRKFNEILLAIQIEQELDKNEIFELYLNKIYLGNRAYGVEAAAQVYYGKPIDELTLAQMAMIAGLPKAPSRYNPINDPRRTLIRRNWILGRMRDFGYISPREYGEAMAAPITASYHGPKIEMEAPYVAEMVRQQMLERYGNAIYTDGFRVYTTIDSHLQTAANEAIEAGLIAYTERHGYRGPIANIREQPELLEGFGESSEADGAKVDPVLAYLDSLEQAGSQLPAVVQKVTDSTVLLLLKGGVSGRIDWDDMKWAKQYISVNAFGYDPQEPSDVLRPGDVVFVRTVSQGRYRLSQTPRAQASLISMNPEDGAIKALVGGFNFYDSMYNRATQAVRQAGSTFKPFVYLAGLNFGLTPATIINDAPIVFEDEGLEGVWRPNNDNMRFSGPMRLREALYRSRNLVSIRILREVGVSRTISYLASLGLSEEALTANLSLALGNISLTPYDLTRAYAVIANGGYQIEPWLVERVDVLDETVYTERPLVAGSFDTDPVEAENRNRQFSPELSIGTEQSDDAIATEATEWSASTWGEVLDGAFGDTADDTNERPGRARRVMDARVNYIINDIMRDVVWKGTARRAQVLERTDIGGKTGTTNDNKDAWFVGFNPEILTSVWVGMDNFSTLGRWEYGANAALPIWIDYMKVALEGTVEVRLQQPPNLETVRINARTGQLARQGDSNTLFELFRVEDVPVDDGVTDTSPSSLDEGSTFSPEDLF